MISVGPDKWFSSRVPVSYARLTIGQVGMICLLYAYGFSIASTLPIGQVGQFFYVIACAEFLAALMRSSNGLDGLTTRKGKLYQTPNTETHRSRLFLIGVFWLSAAVALLAAAPPKVLVGLPFATFSILALAPLVRSILLLSKAPDGRSKFKLTATQSAFLRYGLSIVMTLVAAHFWQVDLQSLLALHLFATILVLGLVLVSAERSNSSRGPTQAVSRFQSECSLSLPTLFYRYADVWVVGWLLAPIEALIYLNARLIVSILDVVIYATLDSFSNSLSITKRREDIQSENAVIARMNLGLLLIGGGTAVALLAVYPMIVPLVPTNQIDAKSVALWLLLASSAPAIWGATDLFLQLYVHRMVHWLFSWLSAVLICSLLFMFHANSALEIATIYASVRLTLGGFAAVFASVTLGFLPGFTAILHRKIRMI